MTLNLYKQNDSHDWFGICAENYIAYQFAAAGFEVFGAGKWAADLAVRRSKTDKWFRIEVKSTDRARKPRRPSLETLKKKAEILVEVRLVENVLETRYTILEKHEGKFRSTKNPKPHELATFLIGE